MHFTIITPSFNQLDYLKRCVASVADQVTEGVKDYDLSVQEDLNPKTKNLNHRLIKPISIHHHIQDACSTDGTVEWLKCYAQEVRGWRSGAGNPKTENLKPNTTVLGYTFSYESESDNGMYDAINKGWLSAADQVECEAKDLRPPTSGPARECVFAHLNCDEQYLPRALKTIAGFFQYHQEVDVVLADMIVVDNDGAYICHRRSLKPHAVLSKICCVGMTTTTFQRALVVRDKKVLFDTRWRNIGDMVWYNALHQAGVQFGICNELVSLFTDTGENLNLTEEALRERKRYAKEYLFGTRIFTRLLSKVYSLRRYLKEFYLKPPTEYALYWNDLTKRAMHPIERPTGLWHRKGVSAQQS